MHKRDLPIPSPCAADFGDMRADAPERRFCDRCDKHVHDLSLLSEREARELLERESRPCVRYLVDRGSGELVFRPEPILGPPSRAQLQGLKHLLAAAALVLPLGIVACEGDAPTAQANAPIAVSQSDGPARLHLAPRPGAPLQVQPPSSQTKPELDPEPCVGEPERIEPPAPPPKEPEQVMEQGEPMLDMLGQPVRLPDPDAAGR